MHPNGETEKKERNYMVVLQTFFDIVELLGNDENAQNKIVNKNRLTLHREEGEEGGRVADAEN